MLLRELFEAEGKHATFCFGRMNPPTIGHAKVFETMAGQGGDYFIFVSQSQDKKENPLDYSTKIKFIKAIHKEYASHVIEDSGINTVVKAASYLYDQGYRDVTFVAGSDRLEQFKKLLTQYNGVEGKAHGFYKFDVLDFVSSGEREDGAEGVAGVSASGARLAAANNDLESFKKATGAGEMAQSMFDAVRKGMGISENLEINELADEEEYYKFIVGKLKLGRILTKREQEFVKTYRLMHKTESTDMKAKEFIPASKPRNFVAKNQKTAGAGAHKDKKRAEKQGDVKHKQKQFEQSMVEAENIGQQMANDGVTYSPEKENEIIDLMAQYMQKAGMSPKQIRYLLSYDEDYVSDQLAFLPRKDMNERVRDPEDWDEGNTEPPNNFAVYINGKKWKVFKGRGQFADDYKERDHYRQLQSWAQQKSAQTGKKWEVSITGEAPTA
jgi:hypothetical protein